jgi:S-adenosylmethionine-diacylglycerol 3-amino-3-carboxypropyl transferase
MLIKYANVWEDADILCTALEERAPKRILSICSSGDNTLALLTLNPEKVIALDLNPAQLACLELRISAFKELDHLGVCQFLGVFPSKERMGVYSRLLERHLSQPARAFWRENQEAVHRGIIHAGKFERYLRSFGKRVLPFIHSRSVIDELFAVKSREERILFYKEAWNNWRWRLLFKLFFSRASMSRLGRDPSFFNQVEGAVAERLFMRSKYALTEYETHRNPFLHYILKGTFSLQALPRYLRPEYFSTIQRRVDRISLFHGSTDEIAEEGFDAFNLSDIFEYMDPEQFEHSYKKLLSIGTKGARLVYWNMLVQRDCPESFKKFVSPLKELSSSLYAQDQAWFYQQFVVEEIL